MTNTGSAGSRDIAGLPIDCSPEPDAEPEAAPLHPRIHGVSGSPVRILIVDDVRDNRELLGLILRWDGFVTTIAASGEDALATLEAFPPDLILLDLMMPGMDGYELSARIRKNPATATTPIILVSAMTDANTRKLAITAGANEFLAKPVNGNALCMQVTRLLGLKMHDA